MTLNLTKFTGEKIMKKTLTFVSIIILSITLACSSSSTEETATTYDSTNTETSNLPKTFTLDLPGQVAKIDNEGYSDELIAKNISDINNDITYKHLKKNSQKHAGKEWAFTGKILEIQEVEGRTVSRIGIDAWGNDAVFVAGNFTTDFVQGDRVYVVGYLAGDYSYESQAGWNINIPSLAARAMMKPNEKAKYKTQGK